MFCLKGAYSMDFSTITLEQVNLAMLAIGLFFVAGGLFWGMVRGFKRTAFRGAWLIITALVLFFVTPLITGMIMNVDLSFLNMEVQGVQLTTIKNLIETIAANEGFGDLLAANPVVLELVQKLPGLLINTFLFVLLFWLTKILLWPIWAIITASVFKRRDAEGNKLKRKRLLGMLTGVVIGLFIGSVTLMPIVNTLNMVSGVEKDTENLTDGQGGIITELAGEDAVVALDYINQTTMSDVYTYTGFSALSEGMYNYLTTTTINEAEVSLRKELKNAIVAYKLATDLMGYDFENVTEELIDDTLVTVNQLVDVVFNIGLVNAVGNDFMPYVLDGLTSGEEFFIQVPSTDNADIDALIMQGLDDISDLQFSDVKNEIKSVISALKTLNDNHVIIGIMDLVQDNPELDLATAQSIADLLPSGVIDQVLTDLFGSKVISIAGPLAIMGAVNYAVDNANIAELNGFELSSTTGEQLKTMLSGLLNTSISILNSLDDTTDYYATSVTISKVGELVDLIKNYGGLTPQSYNLLINLAESKLTEFLNQTDTSSLPASIVANISGIISNLSNITDFGDEFAIYANIFDDVLTVYDAVTTQTDINYQTVGQILDAVKSTALIGNQFNSILANAVDYASDYIPTEFGDFSSVLTTLKANVSANIVWATELPLLGQAVDYAQDLMNETDPVAAATTPAGLLEAGQLLDSLKSSALIGNLIPQILSIGIDYAGDMLPTEYGDFTSILTTIKNNLTNNNIVWATELPLFGDVATYAQSKLDDPNAIDTMLTSAGLTELGELLDDLKQSQLVGNVIPQIIEFAIDYASDFMPTDFGDLTTVIAGIKANVSNNIVWATELPLLADVIDFGQNTLQDPTFMDNIMSSANLATIGQLLDDLQTSQLFGNQVTNLLSSVMTSATSNIDFSGMPQVEDIVDDIITNIENADSNIVWETELSSIGTLLDLADDMTANTDLQLIGAGLDSLDGSQLITRTMINDLVIGFVDTALGADSGTPSTELTAISQIVKDNIVNVVSFEDEFLAIDSFMTDFASVLDGTVDETTINFTSFGQSLDNYDSQTGTIPSVLISATRPYIITHIFDLIEEADTTTGIVANIATDVDNNVQNITSYATEFGYLEELMNTIEDVDTATLATIGTTMDNLTNSAILFNTGSYVLDYLVSEVTDPNSTGIVANITADIAANKANITSYETEFGYLDTLQTTLTNLDTLTPTAIGSTMDTLTNSVILFNTGSYVLDYTFDEAISAATNATVITVLGNMQTNAITQTANDTITYQDAFEQLDNAQTQITNLNGADENSDPNVIGGALNTLQSYSIVGTTNSNIIASNIIDTILDNLDTQKTGSNDTIIQEKQDNITIIQTNMNNATGEVNYVVVFTNIETEIGP